MKSRTLFAAVAAVLLAASAAWGQTWYGLQENGLEPEYRNQDGYGTCWTFGTMSSVESCLIKEGLLPQSTDGLSERDLAWHSGYGGAVDPLNGGGSYMLSAAYFARGDGPLLNSQAPYWSDPSGTGGSLLAGSDPFPNSTTPSPLPRDARPAATYYVRDIEWLHSVDDIKYAILNYGAVATCWAFNTGAWYGASGHWGATSTYRSGSDGPGQPNHSVAIVGWDDDWVTAGGTGAWLIRNSWGGNTQHFGMSYNDFYCGHDSPDTGAQNMGAVSFHNVVVNTFQEIYYHNDLGWTAQQPHAYAFNYFQSDRDGALGAVSFYTTDDNVAYTVNVYTQFDQGVLGQLASTVSGTMAHEGFHTVDLLSLVPLPKDQKFYIELRASNGWQANDGNTSVTVVTGGAADPFVTTTALAGESFFSDNGSDWTDLHTVDKSANFAINALTVAMPPAATSWNRPAGNWADANCWTGGVPWSGGQASVNNGGQVVFSSGVASCSGLTLGSSSRDSGIFHMTGGRLQAACLTVGMESDSNGTFALAGGDLIADRVLVGQRGSGAFTQSDGNHYVHQSLSIATEGNSAGLYTLQGGRLFAGEITVGGDSAAKGGIGTFTISGGSAAVDGKLTIWEGSAAHLGAGTLVDSDPNRPYLDVVNMGTLYIEEGVYCLGGVGGIGAATAGTVVVEGNATLWVRVLEQLSLVIEPGATVYLQGSDANFPDMSVHNDGTLYTGNGPMRFGLLDGDGNTFIGWNEGMFASLAMENYASAIPEPATLALAALGAGLSVLRRRRIHAASLSRP